MKSNNSDKVIQESALKIASAIYVEEEGKRLLEEAKALNEKGSVDEKEILQFEKFCKKEFRKAKIKKVNFSKVAASAAVVVILIGIGVSIGYGINVEKGANSNYVEKNKCKVISPEIRIAPQYWPSKFDIQISNEKNNKLNFVSENGDIILFSYDSITDVLKEYYDQIAKYKLVKINNVDGKLVIDYGYELTWISDDYIFTIKSTGVSEEELIKIAESVRENK